MNCRRIIISLLIVTLAILFAPSLRAENWPHWRGPQMNGSSGETGLPVQFSKTNNVKWSVDLPGPAAATPVVWGNHLFVNSVDLKTKTLVAIALDRRSGKTLWQQQVAEGIRKDDRSNFASPSPVTDGKLVFFYYGNGDLVAFDFDGKKVWSRNIQKDYGPLAFQWTYSTSPTLYEGKLIIQVLQRNVPVGGRGFTDRPNDSYLLALDPTTGQELWKHIRPSEARQESLEAFTTPIPFTHDGRSEILVAGGDCISGHDPASGKELWRWGTWNPDRVTHWRLVPSPVSGGGVVLACGPKGAAVYAVKAGAKGTLQDSGFAWKSQDRDVTTDVSTPLFYKGRFYILDGDKRNMACVEPATGKILWQGNLGNPVTIQASPTAADDKIYVMNFRGDVFVLQTGDQFKVLHTAAFGDEGDNLLRSSIAISQGNLFIRTGGKLYCIGKTM